MVIDIMKGILSEKCVPNLPLPLEFEILCLVCESERSFSKLSSINNEKKNNNAPGSSECIESDYVKKLNFSLLIQKCNASKFRKGNLKELY
jgi:hypothetical protein